MELNRSVVLDRNFRTQLLQLRERRSWLCRQSNLNKGERNLDLSVTPKGSLNSRKLLSLLHSQLKSRVLDLIARELRSSNEGFYTISSSGHEGNALVALHTSKHDMSFLHYRSGAFMMARSDQVPGTTPIYDTCLSLVASAEDPISGGRHKVWGSAELNVPPQTSTIASHLPKAVGAAFAHERTQHTIKAPLLNSKSIFIASFGDASLNHSTAQGALNSASWAAFQNLPVPILFVCEDNGLGISVQTPKNWIRASIAQRPGLKYFFADGRDALKASDTVAAAIKFCRQHRKPSFLHLKVVRLLGHAGSDPEYRYRSEAQIRHSEAQDPVLTTARHVVKLGLLAPETLLEHYDELLTQARKASKMACTRPKHHCSETIREPLNWNWTLTTPRPQASPEKRLEHWQAKLPETTTKQSMARLLNTGLADLLLNDPRLTIFGEDVAKKGGVYTVTNGLAKTFGLRRVFNTLLDEQTILGLALGAAHVGQLPIPEIQYLAYLHNAVDQIRGEASSLRFFSKSQFANPMVLRIASFAYQKGFGGHFHNDNSIASIRDIPGILVVTCSTPADAVKMLRTAVDLAREQQAVVCFLEPIALYLQKDLSQTGDGQFAEPYPEPSQRFEALEDGRFGSEAPEILILSFANGTYLSRQALADLTPKERKKVQIYDIRWLAPLNRKAILAAATNPKKILIVDESRNSGGVHESLASMLLTEFQPCHKIVEVIVGDDTFIPLGQTWAHVLPSRERIVQGLRKLLQRQP